MSTLGQSIIKLRVDQRLKQKDLVERTGLPQRYLSQIENDDVDPRFSTIQVIAQALGVSLGTLMQAIPTDMNGEERERGIDAEEHPLQRTTANTRKGHTC